MKRMIVDANKGEVGAMFYNERFLNVNKYVLLFIMILLTFLVVFNHSVGAITTCNNCGEPTAVWDADTCTYTCSSCGHTSSWHSGDVYCPCGCKICNYCGLHYNMCANSCANCECNACQHTSTYTESLDATCTEDGYVKTICSKCGEELDYVVEAAMGHAYSVYSSTSATCQSQGYTTYKCGWCGDTYNDDYYYGSHSYTYYVSTKAPTCTSGGYDTYECAWCTDRITTNYTSATGHSYTGVAWSYDETNHWQVCKNGCGTKANTAAHADTDLNGKCDTCSYDMAINISNVAKIENILNQVYTGSAIEPTPDVTFNSTTLVAGTDFTYSYSDNVVPGTATVTVTGKNLYAGSVSKTFTIINGSFAGALSISGKAGYNQTLIADVSGIIPNEGVNFTYQWWIADDELGTNKTNIVDATFSSYVIGKSLIGKYIGVSVTASKQYYNSANFDTFIDKEIAGVVGTISVLNAIDYDGLKYVPRNLNLAVDVSGYVSNVDNVRVAILNSEEYAQYVAGNIDDIVWREYESEMSYTLSGNNGIKDIYALFREEFDISFNLNGGTGTTFADSTVFYGDPVVLPIYSGSRSGYTFKGWSTDSTATSAMWANGAVINSCVIEDDTEFFVTWVDEDAPAIALNGSVNSDLPVVVPIKVTELGSGFDSIDEDGILIYVDGVLANPTTKSLDLISSNNGVYEYELVLDGFSDGGDLVVVINDGAVQDLAGNGNAMTTLNTGVTIVVDVDAPVVTLTANDSVDKISGLNAVAVDSSAIAKYEFYLNGELVNTTETSDTEFVYDSHTLFGENTAYVVATDVHGNSGTSNTVTFWDYDIENAIEFRLFSDYVGGNNGKTANSFEGKTVRMLADVDLESVAYTPIGYNGEGANAFKGTFDGLYHSVSNVNISSPDAVVGLFRTNSGTIKNFGIASGTITSGGDYCAAAGVVYYNDQNGLIENCYNNATISTTGSSSGGGGICYMSLGTIRGCYNSGTLSLESTFMGGICAMTCKISLIENCYNVGTLSTTNVGITYSAGGIVGNSMSSMMQNPDGSYTQLAAGGTIKNCYNVGKVTTKATAGGTVSGHAINGNTADGEITGTNNYFLSGSGVASSSNYQYTYYSSGTARSDANMKNAAFLTLLNNGSGAGTWKYVSGVNGGYPVLYWQ